MSWATCILCCSRIGYKMISCFVQYRVYAALCHLVHCDLFQLEELSLIMMRETKYTRQLIHQILQALTLTKMTGMHVSAVFPIQMDYISTDDT